MVMKQKLKLFKHCSFIISFLLFTFIPLLSAHDTPKYTIKERVEKADFVFEGEVIKTESFWLKKDRHIFTKNYIAISKSFKGGWSGDTVLIYTRGGVVDDHFVMHHHDASLSKGFKGMFLCLSEPYRKMKNSGEQGLRLLYENAGFIRYADNKVGPMAFDLGKGFDRLESLYDSVLVVTREPMILTSDVSKVAE